MAPFVSSAQRAFFYTKAKKDPVWKERAERWQKETGKKKLPKHIKTKKNVTKRK